MRKTSTSFKIPSSSKQTTHQFTKSQYQNPSFRHTLESSSRRKQSLPSSAKHDAGLMAQIKQALKNKQLISSDNIQHKLNEAKRMMYEQLQGSKHTRKQNKPNNHQEREITFKDNLKQMQLEISSLKKLMEYEKARNHKIFQEKLFTVQEKFQEHKNIDDKIQILKNLVEESTKNIAKERRSSIQEINISSGKFVSREEYLGLKEQVERMKNQFISISDVDKRIGENLQIFKTFLLQNIDTNILNTIDKKNRQLNEMFNKVIEDTKEQESKYKELIDTSHNQLFNQINILREECQAISQNAVKEQIMKLQESLDDWTNKLQSKMEGQVEKLREEWVQSMDHYQKRLNELENEMPALNLQSESKINMIKQQLSESMILTNQIMDVVKNLIKKVDNKGLGNDQKIIELVKQNMRDIEEMRIQIEEITEEMKYVQSRTQPVTKCVESNIITSACFQKSGEYLLDHSFEN